MVQERKAIGVLEEALGVTEEALKAGAEALRIVKEALKVIVEALRVIRRSVESGGRSIEINGRNESGGEREIRGLEEQTFIMCTFAAMRKEQGSLLSPPRASATAAMGRNNGIEVAVPSWRGQSMEIATILHK